MKGKLILFLVVLSLFVYAIYSTPLFPGKEYLENIFKSLLSPKIPSGFFSFLETSKERFEISGKMGALITFDGEIENSSFHFNGVCLENIVLGKDTVIYLKGEACNIRGRGSGKISVEKSNVIKFEGSLSSLYINGQRYSTKRIVFEVLSRNYSVGNLSSPSILLENSIGEITKFVNGKPDTVKYLERDNVTVYDFIGKIKYQNKTTILDGKTSGVSNDFEW